MRIHFVLKQTLIEDVNLTITSFQWNESSVHFEQLALGWNKVVKNAVYVQASPSFVKGWFTSNMSGCRRKASSLKGNGK